MWVRRTGSSETLRRLALRTLSKRVYQCKQVTQYDMFLASGQTSTLVTMMELQSLLVVSLTGGYLVHCTVP